MADGLVEYLVRVDNQTSAPLTAAAQSADDAADAARRVQGAFASVDVPVRTASASMGAAAAATGNLRAQLIDIGVMLQGGANPLTILSTQGPQVAEALAQMRASGVGVTAALGGLGPILAALAPVVIALGGAYLLLKADLDAANEAAARQAEIADRAGKAATEWHRAVAGVREAYALATGATTELEVAIAKENDRIRDGAKARGEFLAAQRANIELEIQRTGLTGDLQMALHRAREAEQGHARAVEEATLQAEFAIRTEDARRRGIEATNEAQRRAALAATERARAEAAAARAAVAAERARQAEIQEWIAIAEAELTPTTDAAAVALREFYAAVSRAVPPETLSTLDQLALAEADLARALSQGALSADQYAAAMDDLAAARKRAAEAQDGTAGTPASAKPEVTGAGVLGAVAGGPSGLMSLISQVGGPIGAGVAAGLALLQQVGQTTPDGESQFVATFREFFGQLIDALPALGGAIADLATMVIAEVVPALVEAIPAVVAGLVDALPAMMTAIVGALPAISGAIIELMLVGMPRALFEALRLLLTPSFWADMAMAYWEGLKLAARDLGQAIAAALKDILTPFRNDEGTGLFQRGGAVATAARDIGQGIGNVAEGAADWFVGMFASGGYVPRTGLALVHAGERIVPAGASGSAPRSMGRNVTVTVNMPQGAYIGSAADIVRELNRSLGSANLGLRWSDG